MAPKVTEAYKKQRRQEIIEAAQKVFQRKGYGQTVMQDIIQEAGLSRGAVYDYFDNKDHVFRAVIESRDERTRKRFEDLRNAVPFWPRLREMILSSEQDEIYRNDSRNHIRAHIEYVVVHSQSAETFEWMRDRYMWFLNGYRMAFQAATDRGELSPIMPLETIARFIISAADGMLLGVMAGGAREFQLANQTEMLLAFLQYALRPACVEMQKPADDQDSPSTGG